MKIIVLFIGIFILVVGIAILISPAALRQLLHKFLEKRWLPYATALRIIVGVIFVFAAPQTKMPQIIWGLGILFILAGIIIPLLGAKRIEGVANWWLGMPDVVLRLWAVLAGILGILIAWAAL
jgi:hypothetical protein